jgi:hypothetical protein
MKLIPAIQAFYCLLRSHDWFIMGERDVDNWYVNSDIDLTKVKRFVDGSMKTIKEKYEQEELLEQAKSILNKK